MKIHLRKSRIKIISYVFLLLSIFFVYRTAQRLSINVQSLWHSIPSTGSIALSILLLTLANVLGAIEWAWLFQAIDDHVPIRSNIRIHLASKLLKYLPGAIWPYLGKSYWSVENGAVPSCATIGVALENLIIYTSGLLITAIAILIYPLPDMFPPLARWIAGGFIFFVCVGSVLLNTGVLSLPKIFLSRIPKSCSINTYVITPVFISVTLTWIILIASYTTLIVDTGPIDLFWEELIQQAFSLPVALLGGQLIVGIPMGLGIRESILIKLSSLSTTNVTMVISASLLFRIENLLVDFCVGVLAWLIKPNNPEG